MTPEPRTCREPATGELLAAYELGLLEAAERARFEAHLESCPACLEELYAHAPAALALGAEPERWARRLAEAGAGRAGDMGPRRRSGVVVRWREVLRRRVPRRAWLPVGAAAAAALALLLLLPTGGADRLRGLARLEPAPWVRLDVRAGGASRAGEAFADGMQHYAAARYGEAAAVLAAALALGEEEPTWREAEQARFYLGVSLLLGGEAALARPHLAATAGAALRPLAERGRWYLAQCDLALGDGERAREELRELAEHGLAYREEAAAQLAALRRLLAGEGNGGN
jgi:hypothetical protein